MKASQSTNVKNQIVASIPDLLTLLSGQLYAEPEVFLRELLCNSYDAILRRTMAEPINGRVFVRGDGKCVVEVEDNGIGMRYSDLVDFLSCIGKSGTRQALFNVLEPIGRFGLGFLSVLAVANRIIVDTLAAGTEPEASYIWEWAGGPDYVIHNSTRITPGTVVRVELQDRYTGYASPKFLAELVKKHVPFLKVPIEVLPIGEPRLVQVPWQQYTPDNVYRWRDGLDFSTLTSWMNEPLYGFAARFSNGTGGIFAFPKAASFNQGKMAICQQGVLIAEHQEAILPDGWEWTCGVIDIEGVTLTLNRADLKRDDKFEALKQQIAVLLREELIFLCIEKWEVFKSLVEQHRRAITALMVKDGELFEEIGRAYPFTSTLGDLSFAQARERAELKNGKKILYYLKIHPSTDARWAIWHAGNRLLLWCRDEEEENLLKNLVQQARNTELRVLGWTPDPHDGNPPQIFLSEDMKAWLNDLKNYLNNEGILIEPAEFTPDNAIAVVELLNAKNGGQASEIGQQSEVTHFFSRLFNVLTTTLAWQPPNGRLLLNVANPSVQALATHPQCPLELAAALLLTNGAVRSGIPIDVEWQELLDKLTERGIKTLVKGIQPFEAETSLHVVCFFAHEFRSDKKLLAALRRVLEHAPYFWEVQSGEEETKEQQLFENVWKQIRGSHIVMAEITRENPNALLEAGMAYGSKDWGQVLLLAEENSEVFSDLRGQLVFFYKPADLVSSKQIFDDKFRQWVNKQANLKGYKRFRPFLGYRLLVEKEILTNKERETLEYFMPDPFVFLSEPLQKKKRLTHIPEDHLKEAEVYFQERVDRYENQHQQPGESTQIEQLQEP